jgi:hypothetical protein
MKQCARVRTCARAHTHTHTMQQLVTLHCNAHQSHEPFHVVNTTWTTIKPLCSDTWLPCHEHALDWLLHSCSCGVTLPALPIPRHYRMGQSYSMHGNKHTRLDMNTTLVHSGMWCSVLLYRRARLWGNLPPPSSG